MTPKGLISHFTGIILSLGLILSSPAFALKPAETKEGAGLEEIDKTLRAFTSGNINDPKSASVGLTPAVVFTPRSASPFSLLPLNTAGMEEKTKDYFIREEIQQVRPDLLSTLEAHWADLNKQFWDPSEIRKWIKSKVKRERLPGAIDAIHNAVLNGKEKWNRYQEEVRRGEQKKREEEKRKELEEKLLQLPPEERRIHWVQQNLVPVLERLTRSRNLTELSSLREIALTRLFPDDPAVWADTFSLLPMQGQFQDVLNELNRRWLIPRNLLILDTIVFKGGVAQYGSRLRVVRVIRKEAYRYGDTLVPVYYLGLIGSEQEDAVAAYLNDLDAIVIFPDRIAQYMKVKLQGANSPNYTDDYLVKTLRVLPPFYRAIVPFYQRYQRRLREQYGGDEDSYFEDSARNRLQEELRHWMDRHRAGIVDGRFLDNFVQTHLRTSEQGSEVLPKNWTGA